jgi:hypothetical protein
MIVEGRSYWDYNVGHSWGIAMINILKLSYWGYCSLILAFAVGNDWYSGAWMGFLIDYGRDYKVEFFLSYKQTDC